MCAGDPLDEFMKHSMWIPDMNFFTYDMNKLGKQVDSIGLLKDAIGQYQIVVDPKTLQHTDSRKEELFLLSGITKHPYKVNLQQMNENMALEYLFRGKIQKLTTSIQQTLQVMRSCELLQWRIAAMSVDDLKLQVLDSSSWLNDFKCHAEVFRQQRASDNWISSLNGSTMVSQFLSLSTFRIDADLSYMNQILIRLNQCCSMTHAMNVPGAYGQTLRISDVAGLVQVLKDSENGKYKETETYLYDPKFAGSGVDTALQHAGQQNVAHVAHNSKSNDLKALSEECADHSLRNVSKMSFVTIMGSGILVNTSGHIMPHCKLFQRELGLNCHWTEFGKEGGELN